MFFSVENQTRSLLFQTEVAKNGFSQQSSSGTIAEKKRRQNHQTESWSQTEVHAKILAGVRFEII